MFAFLIALISIVTFSSHIAFANESPSEEELILSTPEQLGTLSNSSSFLIKGLVSPISGTLSLRRTDLIVRGAQNIMLERIYLPSPIPSSFPAKKKKKEDWDKYFLYQYLSQNYKGWQFFPHIRLQVYPETNIVRVSDQNGMTLDFKISGMTTTLVSDSYGINNAAEEIPSGKYDPRNTKVLMQENGKTVAIYSPEGNVRTYRYTGEFDYLTKTYFYNLEKEILPNGKVLKYSYFNNQLSTIESLSPDEKYIYANIKIEGFPLMGKCQFSSSSGDEVVYNYEKRPINVKLKNKTKEGKFDNKITSSFPPILKTVSSPFYRHETLNYSDRFLLDEYCGKSEFFNCSYTTFGNSESKNYRLAKLFFPVGQKNTFQQVCEIDYSPVIPGIQEGITTVKNADGTKIIYSFSKEFLIKTIETYDAYDILKLQKCFLWTENQWLKSVEFLDGKNQLFYKKSYEYDQFGNPIVETFTGDLTGEGKIENYSIKREFSQDGRHLFLKEENEEGKVISFEYLPNTNLVTAKFTQYKNQILIREFNIYDAWNNLIQKTTDDGKTKNPHDLYGITQRTLTNYILRQKDPFIHMPEWIEEKYLENNKENLAKRVYLTYDRWGNVCQEDIYDSEEEFIYSIYKTYNERGDLLSETNPLGQEAIYAYDDKGYCIQTSNFSRKLQKYNNYDLRGRVVGEKKLGIDSTSKEFSYAYDANDDLIYKTDEYENVTHYAHDSITHQITKSDFPEILSYEGNAVSVSTKISYDPMRREISKTDANGNTISYKYNARGEKTEILYPNGSKESFVYYKNGNLKKHIDQEGITIYYEYDILGRVLAKKYYSDQKIADETFGYNSFHLVFETDKEGNITKYSYDGLGRKIKEDFCGRVFEYRYDLLGRLATVCKYNGENTLLVNYERDLLNRIIGEKKTDTHGNLLYKISFGFDEDGNRKEITRFINNQPSAEIFNYDCFGRIIWHQDPLGYVTQTTYDDGCINFLGQKVLQKRSVDPKHIITLRTYDPFGHVVKKEILNFEKKILACKEYNFDPCGNLIIHKDHIYKGTKYQNYNLIKYCYNNQNLIESFTRAFGTNNERTTYYTFTPSGKVATKTMPDKTTLSYSYNLFGHLIDLTSSDGTIDYRFERNLLGYLLSASNRIEKTKIERETDSFGNVLYETFLNGLSIEKSYDAFNRPYLIKLGNHGEIHYSYDPLRMKNIARTSNSENSLYTHRYENYDLDGNLLTEELIGSCGRLEYQYDAKGRKRALLSPYFTLFNTYDDCDNLIISEENKQLVQYEYDDLSQLISEKCPDSKYAYDSNYNRLEKNNKQAKFNELDELLSLGEMVCEYNLNGNLTTKKTPQETLHFTYDALNQLKEVSSQNKKIQFTYDPLGRRLSKTVQEAGYFTWNETNKEYYLWDGQNEIGAFTQDGISKNIKILGIHSEMPIAIELSGKAYAPILDIQGNVRYLIAPISKTKEYTYNYTVFGEYSSSQPSLSNPWRYASKRWDEEIALSYYGKRYYDPQLARWLTTDPAGFVDGMNLYQYLYNNPFRYVDPDGQFVFALPLLIWGTELVLPTLTTVAIPLVYGFITGAAAYGGYKLIEGLNSTGCGPNTVWDFPSRFSQNIYKTEVEEEKKNINPFDGPVDQDVIAVDANGNAIKVPQGNWLTGTNDGKWIQERTPDGTTKGQETGTRKDGGHKPGPQHTDPRSLEPHGHVPGVTNPDGTPWLPIRK